MYGKVKEVTDQNSADCKQADIEAVL